MQAALQQVRANKGSPGVDGMSVDELPDFLKAHWPAIKDQLLEGTYQPQVIKRVEIPKPGSQEKRKLGIPCVIDRLIQQAMLQVLQWRWDPTFSEFSYGFRPGRSPTRRSPKPKPILNKVTASWWISIWRSFSIKSAMIV